MLLQSGHEISAGLLGCTNEAGSSQLPRETICLMRLRQCDSTENNAVFISPLLISVWCIFIEVMVDRKYIK